MPTLLEQEFLKPGPYRIGDQLREFSRDDLKAYKDGTIAALKAGVPIPLLEAHAPAGVEEGYPASDADADSAFKARGWLRDLKQREDGTLVNVLEVTDPTAEAGIKNGSIRFTSPEFRERYIDGKGREFGRMIRHVALTHKPRNPDQGPFTKIANATPFGECLQFSDEDMDSTGAVPADSPKPDQEANPDMPKGGNVKKLEEAIKGHLAELGAVLPTGTELGLSEDGANVLLAALMTATQAKAKAEQEKEEKDEPNKLEQDSGGQQSQFSERELKIIAERDAARSALAKERRTGQEAKISAALESLPPALKTKLAARLTSVQFSDDGNEEPALTVLEVATLVKECLPKNLQFDEEKLEETQHEEGGKFFAGESQAAPEVVAMNDQIYRDMGYAEPPRKQPPGTQIVLDGGNYTPPAQADHRPLSRGTRHAAAAK